jgi:hypothetical protein
VGAAPDLAADAHVDAGFLGDFADRGLGGRLVRFDLSAGEGPRGHVVAAAHDEDPALVGDDRDRDRESLGRQRIRLRGRSHFIRERSQRGGKPPPLFRLRELRDEQVHAVREPRQRHVHLGRARVEGDAAVHGDPQQQALVPPRVEVPARMVPQRSLAPGPFGETRLPLAASGGA